MYLILIAVFLHFFCNLMLGNHCSKCSLRWWGSEKEKIKMDSTSPVGNLCGLNSEINPFWGAEGMHAHLFSLLVFGHVTWVVRRCDEKLETRIPKQARAAEKSSYIAWVLALKVVRTSFSGITNHPLSTFSHANLKKRSHSPFDLLKKTRISNLMISVTVFSWHSSAAASSKSLESDMKSKQKWL